MAIIVICIWLARRRMQEIYAFAPAPRFLLLFLLLQSETPEFWPDVGQTCFGVHPIASDVDQHRLPYWHPNLNWNRPVVSPIRPIWAGVGQLRSNSAWHRPRVGPMWPTWAGLSQFRPNLARIRPTLAPKCLARVRPDSAKLGLGIPGSVEGGAEFCLGW